MATYIALLRAVNVGGTGKLPMADLKAMCGKLGFRRIETYIASGNVVFDFDAAPSEVQAMLAGKLADHAGRDVGVLIRTAAELQSVAKENPFRENEPRKVYAYFLRDNPPAAFLDGVRGRGDEQIAAGRSEIYVHYPGGMGRSKLLIPAARHGTARNMNTVGKLVEISARR